MRGLPVASIEIPGTKFPGDVARIVGAMVQELIDVLARAVSHLSMRDGSKDAIEAVRLRSPSFGGTPRAITLVVKIPVRSSGPRVLFSSCKERSRAPVSSLCTSSRLAAFPVAKTGNAALAIASTRSNWVEAESGTPTHVCH